ncbi:hypothetical protein IW262DRAFT_1301781 [Armillaria fumosa]|nr:hypothetical protein IW262DRAFT_1301781 [Armillaria fumosa]
MIFVNQQAVYDEFRDEDFASPDVIAHDLLELQNVALGHAQGRQQSILRAGQLTAQIEQAAEQKKEEAIQSFYKHLVEYRAIEQHSLPCPPEYACPVCKAPEALVKCLKCGFSAVPILLVPATALMDSRNSLGRSAVRAVAGLKKYSRHCQVPTTRRSVQPAKPNPGTRPVLINVPGFALLRCIGCGKSEWCLICRGEEEESNEGSKPNRKLDTGCREEEETKIEWTCKIYCADCREASICCEAPCTSELDLWM